MATHASLWAPKKFGLVHFTPPSRREEAREAARAATRTPGADHGPMVTLEGHVVDCHSQWNSWERRGGSAGKGSDRLEKWIWTESSHLSDEAPCVHHIEVGKEQSE